MTSIINHNSLTEEFMLIYVKMWSPKLLPASYEKFKSLFSVKCNTKSLGKGQGKRIQQFIQHSNISFNNFIHMATIAEKPHNIFLLFDSSSSDEGDMKT